MAPRTHYIVLCRLTSCHCAESLPQLVMRCILPFYDLFVYACRVIPPVFPHRPASASIRVKIHVCEVCGSEHVQWVGRCPTCKEWNCIKPFKVRREQGAVATYGGVFAFDAASALSYPRKLRMGCLESFHCHDALNAMYTEGMCEIRERFCVPEIRSCGVRAIYDSARFIHYLTVMPGYVMGMSR